MLTCFQGSHGEMLGQFDTFIIESCIRPSIIYRLREGFTPLLLEFIARACTRRAESHLDDAELPAL
jgi:hypothetical protein